jgi:F-type H+-transporting ATPase subunit delta
MKSSKITRREAKQIFRACQKDGLLDESRARQTVSLLIAQKPRDYVAILTHFQKLVKLDLERRTARVESAAPISADLQNKLRASLTKAYGPGLDISFGQNPALIGGLRVQIGSDVYDGSVRARLNALQESF